MAYNVKLPSNTQYVTTKNIRRFSKIIADTGRVFTGEDLVKGGSPVNEKNLFRILSYMKYLGLLKEKREKINVNGKKESIQKWYQNERKEVADYFFYLQDNRSQEAENILNKIISGHDLFKSIKEDLIKNRPNTTTVELKDFLRNKLPGKTAKYYTNGANFIISLLEECNLIIFDSNKISLKNMDNIEEKEPEDEMEEINIKKENKSLIQIDENVFLLTIIGKDTNFSFPIKSKSDLEDVEIILNILKKKLT